MTPRGADGRPVPPGELPAALEPHRFLREWVRKAPRRQQVALACSPWLSRPGPVRPRRHKDEWDNIAGGNVIQVRYSHCDFPNPGRARQVDGEPWEEVPLAEFMLGYSTVFCRFLCLMMGPNQGIFFFPNREIVIN